jgi:hypothetical protein
MPRKFQGVVAEHAKNRRAQLLAPSAKNRAGSIGATVEETKVSKWLRLTTQAYALVTGCQVHSLFFNIYCFGRSQNLQTFGWGALVRRRIRVLQPEEHSVPH